MGFEDGANTGGRNRGVIDVFRNFFEMGADFYKVGIDVDLNGLLMLSGEIVKVERTELFIDNRAGAGVRGAFDFRARNRKFTSCGRVPHVSLSR